MQDELSVRQSAIRLRLAGQSVVGPRYLRRSPHSEFEGGEERDSHSYQASAPPK
jgi:hypothetical protein